MAGGVIGVGFGIDEKRTGWEVSFLSAAMTRATESGRWPLSISTTPSGQNDRRIGVVVHRGVDEDSLFELFEMRSQVLRENSAASTKRSQEQPGRSANFFPPSLPSTVVSDHLPVTTL